MRLTEDDYKNLEKCFITRELATAADVYRVPSIEAQALVNRKGAGNFIGIIFPCRWPGEAKIMVYRLRLDAPPTDPRTGKPQYRYLTAAGSRNHFYWPMEDPRWIQDISVPIIFVEGEKKYISLVRVAREMMAAANGKGDGRPPFIPLALFGVWAWRGIIGIRTNQDGVREEERGPIPDFGRVPWADTENNTPRSAYILFDTNVLANSSVGAARNHLARHVESLGGSVHLINLTPGPGVNGIDDWLGIHGWQTFPELIGKAVKYDWREQLVRNEKGKISNTFGNALTALRMAPAFQGVLSFNEFALAVEARRQTPWGAPPGPWSDHHDLLTCEWLERQGVRVGDGVAANAVLTVARESPRHPVKEFLDRLVWDKVPRIDKWLTTYCGAADCDYARAIASRWLISAVARIRAPGCRVDHVLILEADQGAGKSTVFQILGSEFYSDDIADLGTKDSQMGTIGIWVLELSELDSMSRAEVNKIKAFLSRAVDHFRPPYGRTLIRAPRQVVFAGTVNHGSYLRDETGGRRFWPVKCGAIDLEGLKRDRDQLWAEACVRHAAGEVWWLEKEGLVRLASEQQDERYEQDPWEQAIRRWVEAQAKMLGPDATVECTAEDLLINAIGRPMGQCSRGDSGRVGRIIHGRLSDWLIEREGSRARPYDKATGKQGTRIYQFRLKAARAAAEED